MCGIRVPPGDILIAAIRDPIEVALDCSQETLPVAGDLLSPPLSLTHPQASGGEMEPLSTEELV